MPFECRFPVSRLNRLLRGCLFYSQDLVVVLLAGRFLLLLRKLEFLSDLETGRVQARSSSIVLDGLIPHL